MKPFVPIYLIIMTAGLATGLGGCSHVGKTDAHESPLTNGLDVYEINRINQEATVRNADVIWINPPQRKDESEEAEQKEKTETP